MYNESAYIVYLLISIASTVYVGQDLHRNGYHLILDLFDNESITRTINNLLLTGYYLVNIGYIAITIRGFQSIDTEGELFLTVSEKLGTIYLILGVLHYNNVWQLNNLSKYKDKFISMFNTK